MTDWIPFAILPYSRDFRCKVYEGLTSGYHGLLINRFGQFIGISDETTILRDEGGKFREQGYEEVS